MSGSNAKTFDDLSTDSSDSDSGDEAAKTTTKTSTNTAPLKQAKNKTSRSDVRRFIDDAAEEEDDVGRLKKGGDEEEEEEEDYDKTGKWLRLVSSSF